MADWMAAEIWIGGKLPRSLLDEFPISDLKLDFLRDDKNYDPQWGDLGFQYEFEDDHESQDGGYVTDSVGSGFVA